MHLEQGALTKRSKVPGMARVWRVYEGYPNTIGPPWAEMSLDDAARILDLTPGDFKLPLSQTPRFGAKDRDLTLFGYKHVVVEVDSDEAIGEWKPGFYVSPLSPHDALLRMLGARIEARIGNNWRVGLEEGRDADGDEALWAWVALKTEAPATAWQRENRQRVETTVREAVAESGLSDWVYVRFRKEAEERAAS